MSGEVIRSGFLEDGRFYSIELAPHSVGWVARFVCVPGGQARTVKVGSDKHGLRVWAEQLSAEDLERLTQAEDEA